MRNVQMHVLLFLLLLLLPACALADGGQVSGFAWVDGKGDLTFDEKDSTLRGVQVSLFRVQGEEEALVEKVTTSNDGAFLFANLPAGDYKLSVTLPKNYQPILPREGSSVIMPACGADSASAVFSLAENQVLDTMHVGASKSSGYIKAYVFHDANANGGRRTSEELLRNVPTELLYEYNGEWIVIASASSDKDGCVTYWDLTPGTYRLSVTLPDPYIVGPLGEKITGWYNVIVPDDSNRGISAPFDVPRGGSTGLGIGAIETGSVEGMIWHDLNSNGLQDAGEAGFAGAAVMLYNETNGVDRKVSSDENGVYHFDRLAEGEYALTVTLPDGVMFTLPGGESLFTDGYVLTQSTTVSVVKNATAAVQKIGAMPATALEITVYNDLNANGLRDEGEPPFAGAALNILVQESALISAQSDGSGQIYIPVLRGGEMALSLTLPAGQVFTVPGENNHFTALNAQSSITLPIDLQHGQVTRLQAGITLPASISGTLFNDENVSGLPENEGGLNGFTVQAIDANGLVAAETTTDENGFYRLDALLPAPHVIRFCLKDAYVFSDYADVDVANRNQVVAQTALHGETAVLPLAPGQQLESICGGAFRSATVSGSVLLSAGKAAEILTGGMENVLVELLDADGFAVSDTTTTRTIGDGSFYLKGALPGEYMLQFTLPEGCIFTDPLLNSNVYTTELMTLGAAEDLTLPALAAVPAGTLNGSIYYDSNVNGQFDQGAESIYEGIVVTLVNLDYDMTYETRTMEDGSFAFYDLRPGAFTISVTLPEALCFAHDASSLLPASIQSAATAEFMLLAGQAYDGSNIAVTTPAGLSGTLYYDLSNNNLLDPVDFGADGITIVLQSADAQHSYTAITDEDGRFTLSPIVSGNYHLLVSLTGDCIPSDGNPAKLENGFYRSDVRIENGEQAQLDYAILRYATISGRVYSTDGTLKGVAGRTVTLLNESGVQLKQAVTDENGVYSFANLKPGAYYLSCDLPDDSYEFARKGSDSVITHAEPPACEKITVPMGESISCRIGIGTPGRLGDTAWLDRNRNGLQDAGEEGVPGIEIALYLYGEKVAETVTDGYGRYQFADVFPGTYDMKVTMPKELRATVQRSDFPLLGSILPETDDAIVEFGGVLIPSGGRNLNCDLGFVLVEDDVYPGSMMNLPQIDWNYKTR